jgi:hypothetical protein
MANILSYTISSLTPIDVNEWIVPAACHFLLGFRGLSIALGTFFHLEAIMLGRSRPLYNRQVFLPSFQFASSQQSSTPHHILSEQIREDSAENTSRVRDSQEIEVRLTALFDSQVHHRSPNIKAIIEGVGKIVGVVFRCCCT